MKGNENIYRHFDKFENIFIILFKSKRVIDIFQNIDQSMEFKKNE